MLLVLTGCSDSIPCDKVRSSDVIGYYYPHTIEDGRESEFVVIKKDSSYVHVGIFNGDTLIERGNWNLFENDCQISFSNFSWQNRYLLEEHKESSSAVFKWKDGLLDIGLDQLNFSKKSKKPPHNVIW